MIATAFGVLGELGACEADVESAQIFSLPCSWDFAEEKGGAWFCA